MNRLRKMSLSKGKMLVATLVFALTAMSFVACEQAPAVSGIAITGMPEGNKIVLTDTVTTHKLGFALSPQNAKSDVIWSSSDKTVAMIDNDGMLTLYGEGVTVITVSLKDNVQIKAEEVLSVSDERTPTATIEIAGLTQEKVALSAGEIQLSATCSDENATIEWLSSNEGIAAVSERGLVTFRTAGTVKITAYKQGDSAVRKAVTLHIVNPVQSLTIEDVASGAVLTGYEYALATSFAPLDADAFDIEWSVDDDGTAEIDASGKLSGKKNGNVAVTAKVKDSNVKATKNFKVVALDKNSEDFSYAQVGDNTVIGDHTYYGLDYTSSRVTSEYLEFSFNEYGENKRALVAEKTGKQYYWTDLSLGDWTLEKGYYELTLDMDVEGKPSGHIFLSTYHQNKIEKSNGTAWGGQLSDYKVDDKYVLTFYVNESKEHACVTIGSNYGSDATQPESKDCAYKYTVRSFMLRKLNDAGITGAETFESGEMSGKIPLWGRNSIILSGGQTDVFVFGAGVSASIDSVTGKNGKSLKIEGDTGWHEISLAFTDNAEQGKYKVELYYNLASGSHSFHYYLAEKKSFDIYEIYDKFENTVSQVTGYTNASVVSFDIVVPQEFAGKTLGIMLASNSAVAYTLYLDDFKVTKYAEIESVSIGGSDKLATGSEMDLTESVTYASNVSEGQGYACEWSVAGKGDKPGDAKIEGNKLIALRPGIVTVTCKVTSNTGKVFTVTKDITINLGDLAVSIDNGYGDSVLVAGKEYPISVTKFDESCAIQYHYSVEGVIKVENDKISALKAGSVTLTVSTSYDSERVKKEIDIMVLDFSKTEDKNYAYAKYAEANNKHGDWFDVDRTAVYTRTFNMNIAIEDNALKLTKNYAPADGTAVMFMLGDVEAGYYKVTFGLRGNLDWAHFRGYLYAINWKDKFMETYNDTVYAQAANPYGNIHDAHVFSYSGANSTAGGTYTTYINLATAQKNFGLALKTWEEAGKSYSIYLDGMSFEKVEYPQSYDFENTNRVCANAAGYSHIVVGDNGGGIWCKGTNSVTIIEQNGGKAMEVVIPDTNWAEVSFRLGTVKAGTYTVTFDLQCTDGNNLTHYCLGTFDSQNNRSDITDTLTALSNVASSGEGTYTLEITLSEDVDEFAFVLATNAHYGKVVLDNFTFTPKAA